MTTTQKNLPSQVIPVNGVLVGSVIGYGGIISGNSPAPAGWLFCDGSAVSRSTYADLFSVIGSQHGGGDGTSTFNLPDHRGQFHRGVDDGTGNDPDSSTRTAANQGGAVGDQVGSVQGRATARPTAEAFGTDSQGGHTHSIDNLPTASSHSYVSASHYARWNSESADSDSVADHSHSTTAGGGDADTCPINIYLNYLIYYGMTS
ncbi:microcystin-dependent protein [Kitasatospora sp. MAP12-15]|uniref:phage tail protein n=1 Tax=unclassified Kitasatospora TaxID=2633591 RepID=UPI002475F4EE|nr:phage tail protein [Kitasatospora sp. MAP12-44]MDH6115349.1 microcystin-dependent protein [Kitasatospora sp. MAP12-44]